MRAAIVLSIFFFAALASPASADDSDQALTEAKKHFQIGTMSYDVGEYEQALQAFERARALKPLPGFLFNIGQCHRKLGRHDEAVRFFEQYVAESPKAKNRAEVDALLAEERALLAAAPPAEVKPSGNDVVAPTEPLAPEVPPAQPTAGEETSVWLWAAIGGGALVVAAGTAVAIALIPTESQASLGRVDLRGAQ